MVYRGKPSAGCANCRESKKRCGLEQPSCLRCVKLNKACTGYRDTTQLQIQDESEAVRQKAQRAKKQRANHRPASQLLAPPATSKTVNLSAEILTPVSMNSDSSRSSSSSSSSSENTFGPKPSEDSRAEQALAMLDEASRWGIVGATASTLTMTSQIRPNSDDVASIYFLHNFTSSAQGWSTRDIAHLWKRDPCLKLAIRACGLAVMTTVEFVPGGKFYAQANYVEALRLVNQALQDQGKSRSDETLVAVSMLGVYENILYDGGHSMMSWKAHITGATQMLKLRGRAQFKTHLGRTMFREIRAQILIACLWDDREAPAFLREYQSELEAQTTHEWDRLWKIADDLAELYLRLAKLRRQRFAGEVTDRVAADGAAELERALIQWSVDAFAHSHFWQFYELEVDESEHIWDRRILAYAGNPAPTLWNQWRILRIILSKMQELLSRRLAVSEHALAEQLASLRKLRRRMADEICQTVPVCLGHGSPAFSSPNVFATAYASLWSLFFAAAMLIEHVGPDARYLLSGLPVPPGKTQSKAYAQTAWVLGRLRYISEHVGLKWANGVMSVLRGELRGSSQRLVDSSNGPSSQHGRHVPVLERAFWLRVVK